MQLRTLSIILVAVCLVVAACAQSAEKSATPPAQTASQGAPEITLSTARVVHPAHLEMRGSRFTPKHNALSHLKRSDGTEFPVLTILTDAHGEFTHEIDSLLLAVGVHELWVIDETTGVSSNVARFEVVRE